jgi:hypothetical protein
LENYETTKLLRQFNVQPVANQNGQSVFNHWYYFLCFNLRMDGKSIMNIELISETTEKRERAVNRNRPMWLIAADYNKRSVELNGNVTTTLRRKKGEQVDLKFEMLGQK